jgi:HSP20 family molecular chaperone IbpA
MDSDWMLNPFGILDDVENISRNSALTKSLPQMKIDVVERENDFQVLADLPGVDMKDVDIQVANGALHISANRRQSHEEKTEFSHRIERSFGKVQRSIPVPKNALAESADARFENGVLTVQFEKRPQIENEGPRKLQIKSSLSGSDGSKSKEIKDSNQNKDSNVSKDTSQSKDTNLSKDSRA